MFYAGAMTASAAKKLERFSDFCNSFHIPIISLVDEPGFMIGPDSEKQGTIRHGTATITAILQSRVPWASVHVHKSFGVAATAHFGPESFTLLWPSALSGALPVEGGVAVAFSKEIESADNPKEKQRELEDLLGKRQSPNPRAEGFSAHDIIDPRETRPKLISWLELALAAYKLKSPSPFMTTMRP
jgi:acetyl-CoA carboxylase carboxyltransferase component